ncbi:prephenate dehydrogenase [Lactobacillaceae bacterium Scapto_B20]
MFINGLGLIGASMARIIKAKDPSIQISAHDLNQANLDFMLDHQLIDASVDFETGAKEADLIILATPVKQIATSIAELVQLPLKPGVLVTDVGSNKERILAAAQPLMEHGIHFLGGHPMAGSHLSGSQYSNIEMLQNHTYFLVNGNASREDINQFEQLLAPGKLAFNELTATQHDQLVSATSHLPHLVAFTLINTIAPELDEMPIDPGIPSGGLLDTTRVAKADPDMWASIMTSEDADLLEQIDQFEHQLQVLKQAIQDHDTEVIEQKIKAANHERLALEDLK